MIKHVYMIISEKGLRIHLQIYFYEYLECVHGDQMQYLRQMWY